VEAYNKEASRKLRNEIRRILMSNWDPIGVSDVPEPADEYDRYIGGIFDLLNRGASGREITRYLLWVETDRMGLTDLSGDPLLPAEIRAAAVTELQRLVAS
jgi:hypothetical protein